MLIYSFMFEFLLLSDHAGFVGFENVCIFANRKTKKDLLAQLV